jgi:hypothetical protein
MPQQLVELPTDHQLRREWRKSQSELYEEHQKAQGNRYVAVKPFH